MKAIKDLRLFLVGLFCFIALLGGYFVQTAIADSGDSSNISEPMENQKEESDDDEDHEKEHDDDDELGIHAPGRWGDFFLVLLCHSGSPRE